MRFALRHADSVIANSDHTRSELLGMGVEASHITQIYPGVDIERFHPGLRCDDLKTSIGLNPHQKLILSVGRLSRRKGFDMVISSMSELLKQGVDVHYALIGIGEDWDYLAGLAQKMGVAERVHMLGHVSPENLPRWYNACDVFAMPNREINGDNEGFGMVFIEAAACGKPAIAGRDGGTGSAVVDRVTGFRVDGTRVADVAHALLEVLQSPDMARGLGGAAMQRSLSEFSWERVAQKTNGIGIRG
jgi:phosphatidylinositol alpha-1,6-mannosyltransferase